MYLNSTAILKLYDKILRFSSYFQEINCKKQKNMEKHKTETSKKSCNS